MPAISGQTRRVSLLRWDPESCSWRTPQASFTPLMELHTLSPYSETLPAWVMWDGRELYRLEMSEQVTGETGGGAWPTPQSEEMRRRGPSWASKKRKGQSLIADVEMGRWATPTSRDSKGKDIPNRQGSHSLSHQAPRSGIGGQKSSEDGRHLNPLWRTPHASHPIGVKPEKLQETELGHRMHRQDGTNQTQDTQLQARIMMGDSKKRLNPLFVEWLMGYPIGASDLKPLETGLCQQWLATFSGG